MEQIKLKWVIAHEPAYLFYRVAEDFKRLVNQHSDAVNVDIEILTSAEYNEKYSPSEPVHRHNLWKLLQDGTVQITQMQTTSLAKQFNRQMHVLDLPYLFDNHDQAQDTLEGEVGQYLLNSFDQSSRLKGLAYTYSGGFRLMPFSGTVSSLAELVGQPVRSGMSDIAQDTIRAFGFDPVPTEIDQVSAAINADQAVGAEHVAQRLFPDQCENWINTIIDTEHSLFLTSIVVNVDWWNSLDQTVQQVFADAAREAARNERVLSVADGDASIKKLQDNGVTVIHLSQEEKAELQQRTQSVYDKYDNGYFEPGLIQSIRKH
jgi:TRAP-type C4-dicarboxylate transport system substrate-binding protein